MKLQAIKIILCISVSLAFADEKIEIKTSPGQDFFIGDFVRFSCSGPKNVYENLTWEYEFKDGQKKDVNLAEIAEDKTISSDAKIERKTYIKIKSDLKGINCYGVDGNGRSGEFSHIDLRVENHRKVDALEEPSCNKTPKIILKRWDNTFQSQYWVSHYVTDKTVSVSNQVTGLKLTCLSAESLKWITTENLTEFQYGATRYPDNNGCYFAILILNPLTSLSNQKYICGKDKDGSYVDINIPPVRNHPELDFNKTQECIEHLGTTIFGSQALTWATTGTSLLSVGMMVGIVFLKKQLDKQKEQNSNNSGSGNAQNNPTASGPSSVETQS